MLLQTGEGGGDGRDSDERMYGCVSVMCVCACGGDGMGVSLIEGRVEACQ